MKKISYEKMLCVAILISSCAALAVEKSETTGDSANKQANSSTQTGRNEPVPFYFEEDWIAIPVDPSANLNVVRFDKGSSTLTDDQQTRLRKSVTALRKSGPVKEAYVAVYADNLREGTRDLPEADQKLARQRAKAIRNYLEDDFGIDTVTFNMAARPGWWAKLWNTENAKVTASADNTRNWIADLLRSHSQASSATVVFANRSGRNLAE